VGARGKYEIRSTEQIQNSNDGNSKLARADGFGAPSSGAVRDRNRVLECGALSPLWTAADSTAGDGVQQASEHKLAVVASRSSQSGDRAPHSKMRAGKQEIANE